MLTTKIYQSNIDVHYLETQGVDRETLQDLQTQGVDIKSIEDTFHVIENLFEGREKLYQENLKKMEEAKTRLRNRGWDF